MFGGSGSEVSGKVQHFISRYIRAVWQLEILLTLMASSKPLNSAEIANILYISKDSIEGALINFSKSGLIQLTDGGYVCSKDDPELLDAIKQTSKAYTERKSAVINLIFAGPKRSAGA